MAITDWPADERPREKLLRFGAQQLSDAELLAIFLRTGCAGKSAVDLARDLLNQFSGLRALLEADKESFCRARGLGDAKFAQLQAVLEMARRHLSESLSRDNAFTQAEEVRLFLTAKLRHKKREVFSVLFLDNQHHLLAYEELFQGTINSAQVHPREIIKRALELNAAATILAHNHPSGDSTPSQADMAITSDIKTVLNTMDIRLLDHFIVGEGETLSFAEQGLL